MMGLPLPAGRRLFLKSPASQNVSETKGAHMKSIQAVCDKCKKTVDAKPLLSENELWEALNKGDEIEVMHLADDVHHTWKLTGQDKDSLRKARAAGTV
jgi:hypothetical protein